MTTFKNIKCLVFDAFGTLVEINDKRRPFTQLLGEFEAAGRLRQSDDAIRLMSNPLLLTDCANFFGIDLPPSRLAKIEAELRIEIESIRTFKEVKSTLDALRGAGYKIALCSNLAAPYALPVKRLMPFEFDAYAWSFEVGDIKPNPAIYAHLCRSLSCMPSDVLMIGDNIEADYNGPRRVGFNALHLSRKGESAVTDTIKSIDQVFAFL